MAQRRTHPHGDIAPALPSIGESPSHSSLSRSDSVRPTSLSSFAQEDEFYEHEPCAPYDDDPIELSDDEEEESSGEELPQDSELQREEMETHPPQEEASRSNANRSVGPSRKRRDTSFQVEFESSESSEEHDPAAQLNSLFLRLEVPIKERILLCRGYASYLAAGARSQSLRHQEKKPRRLSKT